MVIVSTGAVKKYDDVQVTQRTFVTKTNSINVLNTTDVSELP